MQLILASDAAAPRLHRTIPTIVIIVPTSITEGDLRSQLVQWLDATQRRCAMKLWNNHNMAMPEGAREAVLAC